MKDYVDLSASQRSAAVIVWMLCAIVIALMCAAVIVEWVL